MAKPIINRRITKGGITKRNNEKRNNKRPNNEKDGKTTNYNQKIRKCLNQTKTKYSNKRIHENGATGINKLRTAGAWLQSCAWDNHGAEVLRNPWPGTANFGTFGRRWFCDRPPQHQHSPCPPPRTRTVRRLHSTTTPSRQRLPGRPRGWGGLPTTWSTTNSSL